MATQETEKPAWMPTSWMDNEPSGLTEEEKERFHAEQGYLYDNRERADVHKFEVWRWYQRREGTWGSPSRWLRAGYADSRSQAWTLADALFKTHRWYIEVWCVGDQLHCHHGPVQLMDIFDPTAPAETGGRVSGDKYNRPGEPLEAFKARIAADPWVKEQFAKGAKKRT